MKSPSAIAQSCSHRHGAGTRPIRECDRMPLSPTISKSHVPSRFAGSSRAHESRSPLSRPSSDISVSTPDGPSNHVSCALPVGSVSCDHITLSCPSPARRGVSTIPEGDTNSDDLSRHAFLLYRYKRFLTNFSDLVNIYFPGYSVGQRT